MEPNHDIPKSQPAALHRLYPMGPHSFEGLPFLAEPSMRGKRALIETSY